MTRKDFELIADVIRNMPSSFPYEQRSFIAHRFALALHKANARFDVDTFMDACLTEASRV